MSTFQSTLFQPGLYLGSHFTHGLMETALSNRMATKAIIGFLIGVGIFLVSGPATAGPVAPPDDPHESITYWKPFVVSPDDDPTVALAHQTFSRLLRGWDGARIPPRLYVVHSETGPWAASLDDGSILLSREAIDTCFKNGRREGENRLAFVVAHELAHQRSDDLWHRRFFRLAGGQAPEVRERILRGLGASEMDIHTLEEKEARADRDAVTLMAIVGYNPMSVVGNPRFFTAWVESIWAGSCAEGALSEADREVCDQALRRSERARARLYEIANQSTLFELGVQAYVAGTYAQARAYFAAFGRDFPARAVHDNIGLTYLAQALSIRQELSEAGLYPGPRFVFPLVLESEPGIPEEPEIPTRGAPGTRGLGNAGPSPRQLEQLKEEMDALLDKAVSAFEQALKVDPASRTSYVHLASAYLIARNTPMGRGIVEGKYRPRFGVDLASGVLLAVSTAMDGDAQAARQQLERLVAQGDLADAGEDGNRDLLWFTAYANLAALLESSGDKAEDRAMWQRLARQAKRAGNATLFRMAVSRLRPAASPGGTAPAATVHGYRLGQRLPVAPEGALHIMSDEIWLEGERLQLYRFEDGARLLVDSTQHLIAAWQDGGPAQISGLAVGQVADRPMKAHGLPTRTVAMVHGEYLAYDRLGLAFRLVDGKIAGWFLYPSKG